MTTPARMVFLTSITGHLFPSDQEALAERMDEVYLGSLTDTRTAAPDRRVVHLAGSET